MQALLEDNGGEGFMHDVAEAEAWDAAEAAAADEPDPDEPQPALAQLQDHQGQGPVSQGDPRDLPGGSSGDSAVSQHGAQPGLSAPDRRELLARAAEARLNPASVQQVRIFTCDCCLRNVGACVCA